MMKKIDERRFFMNGKRLKSNKEFDHFLETLETLEPNKYLVLGKYLNADTYLLMKHHECGKTLHVTPGQFKKGARCPHCEH